MLRVALKSRKIAPTGFKRLPRCTSLRFFGLLDPLKPLANTPDIAALLKDKTALDFFEDDVMTAIDKAATPVHLYSVYRLRVVIKWLFQIETFIAYFITILCGVALYKAYNEAALEQKTLSSEEKKALKRKQRRRKFAFKDIAPFAFVGSAIFSALMFHLNRKHRLALVRHLTFDPATRKYTVEIYGRKLGKIIQESFDINEITFKRNREIEPYVLTFKVPGESIERRVKTSGVWSSSRLVPLIEKYYGHTEPGLESNRSQKAQSKKL